MSAPGTDQERSGVGALDEALDDMGPIDYMVVEFPGDRMTGKGLPLLLDLVERRIIRLLDLEFLRREPDGTITRLAIEDVDGHAEIDLTVFSGASSGLIGGDDVEAAAAVLEPGCTAVVVVYENLWAAPLARELRRGGAQLVAGGRVPVQAVLASLDAAESSA